MTVILEYITMGSYGCAMNGNRIFSVAIKKLFGSWPRINGLHFVEYFIYKKKMMYNLGIVQ
jgi:hypothetical protein